jgi:dihydroxy-acid dehydratase
MALAGSTNAIIHLTAIARRAGVTLGLRDFDRVGRAVPVLVNCKPAGQGYAEDLHHAGGMPTLLKALEPLLDTSVMTCAGVTLGELLRPVGQPGNWQNIIRPLDRPLKEPGALAALFGSLAPDGAVIKAAAATPALMKHQGPAVVFHSPEDVERRLDDPALGITPEHVMVLQNAGPVAAGMPEAGSFPLPRSLAARGLKDMVRVSDARMSGTAYGTTVLHVSPEAAVGGPLALVRDGDLISLDVAARRIDLLVDERELAQRRTEWAPPARAERGWRRLYQEHVQQAHLGCDLDIF